MNILERVLWYSYVCISVGNISRVELWVVQYVFLADNNKLFNKAIEPFLLFAFL
jgi:hypothetical protein